MTDGIDVLSVANDFVTKCDACPRLDVFADMLTALTVVQCLRQFSMTLIENLTLRSSLLYSMSEAVNAI